MGAALSTAWARVWEALGFRGRPSVIVLLGLDNAGKTTLLRRLRNRTLTTFAPTERANMEEFEVGNVSFRAWDLGGHETVRHLWDTYAAEANAIVFLVDSADAERFDEARVELEELLSNEALTNTPIAIVFNKVDLQIACPKVELMGYLGLQEMLSTHAQRPIQVFTASLLHDMGYLEVFEWLSRVLR